MQDSDDQRPSGFPPSELAQRLLRRATHRVGMIDVRHGEEIHARTAGWAAQRFSLLEHWRTRYGGEEHSSPAMQAMTMRTAAMPFAESSFAQAPGAAAMPPSEGVSFIRNQPAVAPPADSAAEAGIKLRVKRPNTGPSLALPVETKSPPLPQGNEVRVPGSSSPKTILQRKLVEGSEPLLHVREGGSVGGSLPDMPMQRQRGGSTSVLSPEQPAPSQTGRSIDSAAATRSDPLASESLPQVAELGPASTSAPQVHLRRRKSEGGAAAVETLPLIRAGKVAEVPDSQLRAGGEQSSQVVVSPLPQVSELPAPSASAPQMHLQRKQSETGVVDGEVLSLGHGVTPAISASQPPTRSEQLRVTARSVPQVGELPSPGASTQEMHLQRKLGEKGAAAGEILPLVRGGEVARASDLHPHAASEQLHVVLGPVPQVEELPAPGASAQEMHLQQLRTGDDQSLSAVTPLPQVKELQPPNASSPQMHLQRKNSETGIVTGEVLPLSHRSESTRASDPQPRATSEQSRAVAESLAQVGEPLIHLRPQQSETGSVAESLPRMAEINIGSDDSPILRLQRKAAQSGVSFPGRPATSSTANGSETPTITGDRPIPVTREIHFTSGPGAVPMIWRSSDKNGSGKGEVSSAAPLVTSSAHHNGFQIMRQNDAGPAPASAAGASPPPAAPSNDGIDVKGMAEQVSRIIARQLVIERERRGKTR